MRVPLLPPEWYAPGCTFTRPLPPPAKSGCPESTASQLASLSCMNSPEDVGPLVALPWSLVTNDTLTRPSHWYAPISPFLKLSSGGGTFEFETQRSRLQNAWSLDSPPRPPSQRWGSLKLAPLLPLNPLKVRTYSFTKFIEYLLSYKEIFKVLWKQRRLE